MGFSDARNERARAETGRNATNHGGGDPRAAAQRNTNAMASRNAVTGNMPRGFRRTPNPTPEYDMSLHNMIELSKMMPGPVMGLRAGVGALAPGLGLGPDFTGYRGNVQGPGDYDSINRFGAGLLARMNAASGRKPRGLQRGY